jgi:hypothetical protein
LQYKCPLMIQADIVKLNGPDQNRNSREGLNAAGSNNMDTESVDLIAAWHDLYVMLGTSSAALIGLLFIATSIHLSDVVSNPGFRVRSYNQTLYLLTLLVEAILILVPQPVWFLGAELMALNLVGLWIALSTSYTFIYKHRDDSHRGGMKMSRAIPLTVAYLLGIAGGITLIQGSRWGMYIVTVSYTTLLVTVVLGAWSTMVGIEQRQLAVEQREKAGS